MGGLRGIGRPHRQFTLEWSPDKALGIPAMTTLIRTTVRYHAVCIGLHFDWTLARATPEHPRPDRTLIVL
jgi:hypothetical protein